MHTSPTISFQSILYKNSPADAINENTPAIFTDLHLDQVIDKMTEGKEEYHLKPFFYRCLQDRASIVYRQQIMQDLERQDVRKGIDSFACSMQQMRQLLQRSSRCPHQYQGERLFLDAVALYCSSVCLLRQQLQDAQVTSAGLCSFNRFLYTYTGSEKFTALVQETEKIIAGLKNVKYNIHIQALTVSVLPYQPQPGYSEETECLYNRFRVAGTKDYRKEYPFTTEMNHVETGILKGVATLYPELFQSLCNFFTTYRFFSDKTVLAFDREIQFYTACLNYCEKVKVQGASFCYPEIAVAADNIYANETYDIALAYKMAEDGKMPVYNDFILSGKERIIIISGPNQGGKTTFARTFGQLHYMACLGCPVPGNAAKLMLFDAIYTHFEREENMETHRSKFEEELVRIHAILQEASEKSIIILNEIFSSTTLQDALFLCRNIMQHLIRLNAYCVWVTFIDELVTLSETTVSMASTVVADHPAIRTFKIVRKAPDGIAYALSIAEKYHVTYNQLKERMDT